MLPIPQIEALRRISPQLYEALKRISAALDPPGTIATTNPSQTQFLAKGSVPPTWNPQFSYNATPTAITWSWVNMQILRADGTYTTIPDGTVTISSLVASTTYYFYPYWDETAQALLWVGSGRGTPAFAQSARTNTAAQSQALQGLVPLSAGAMAAATPASGTSGGTGGGSGSCLRAGMMVQTQQRGIRPVERCKVGDRLLGRDGWTNITRLEIAPATVFLRLEFSNDEILEVTPQHMFTLADGSPIRAERLCLADMFVGKFGWLTLRRIETVKEKAKKVLVSCAPRQEFYAGKIAPTVLTHNYTFSS
jgi:hypothetical protein